MSLEDRAGDRQAQAGAGDLQPLDVLAAEEARFTASLSEPGLVDNSLMGSGVRFDYRWQLRRQ